MGWLDKSKATIELNGVEVAALKKLSLVSHALAKKISGSAGEEQKCIATVLDDVIRQFELGVAASGKP